MLAIRVGDVGWIDFDEIDAGKGQYPVSINSDGQATIKLKLELVHNPFLYAPSSKMVREEGSSRGAGDWAIIHRDKDDLPITLGTSIIPHALHHALVCLGIPLRAEVVEYSVGRTPNPKLMHIRLTVGKEASRIANPCTWLTARVKLLQSSMEAISGTTAKAEVANLA